MAENFCGTDRAHLRSIYPDEFDNFVERMRAEVHNLNFFFKNVDVIGKMLEMVLDTEDIALGVSRSE